MQSLREDMKRLVERIEVVIREPQYSTDPDPHWSVCQRLATEFELWDRDDRFPIWLSRIVAGAIADAEAE